VLSAAAQNLYVSARDYSGGNVLRFTWDGLRSTYASGLGAPQGLAMDSGGNLFVGETTYNGHIYRYKPDGTRTTFASGFPGQIHLACDSAGNLFVSGTFGDIVSGNIYKFTRSGVRTIFASGMYAPASLALTTRVICLWWT